MSDFIVQPTRCAICGSSEGDVEATGCDYIYGGSSQTCVAVRCAGCGHVYLNPRPIPAEAGVLYPANYASFSGKFTHGNSWLARAKEHIMMRRVRKLLAGLPAGARFLDIGCGDGQLLEAVKRQFPGLEVHGLDWRFSPEVRARLAAMGIVLHESMLENAELPESGFDLVTMNQLIEHLWEPADCLRMVRRILAPQGRLALTTPNIDGYDRRFFKSGLWGGYYFPRHLNLFSRSSIGRLMSDCGLEVEEYRSLVAPVVWCYSLKAWVRTRFPANRRLYDACDVHNIPLMALFTAADMFAIVLGVPTSNQSLVVRHAGRPAGEAAP